MPVVTWVRNVRTTTAVARCPPRSFSVRSTLIRIACVLAPRSLRFDGLFFPNDHGRTDRNRSVGITAWFKNGDSPPSQASTTTQKTGSGEVPVPVFEPCRNYCSGASFSCSSGPATAVGKGKSCKL